MLCCLDCQVPADSNPTLNCNNNTLVITWPTSTVYRADITSIPTDVKFQITNRLIQKGKLMLPIMVLFRQPP